MKHILKLDSVTLNFGGLSAVAHVWWEVPYFGIHGIIGPNGAGKSTLFNLITGIYKPSSGAIQFEGSEIHHLKTPEIVRLGIARTFQNIRLLPHLTVLENLNVVTAVERENTFWRSLFRTAGTRLQVNELAQRARSLLELVGLAGAEKKLAKFLPYGDQRKLEIARALMRKPKLLLLDEPAAGMNPTEKEALGLVLKQIASEKITILVIEHDMKFVMNACQDITVLSSGSVCAKGPPHEIAENPRVIELYLGSRAGYVKKTK